MHHLATFSRESSAELLAGQMELRQIRTGLRGDHTSSNGTIFNLFVSDRQAQDAEEILTAYCDKSESPSIRADFLVCPQCQSNSIHPAASDSALPFEPHFRLRQTSGEPVAMICSACNHSWS